MMRSSPAWMAAKILAGAPRDEMSPDRTTFVSTTALITRVVYQAGPTTVAA